MSLVGRTFLRQFCSDVCVHLSCKTSVAERQGRSSRVWRSSTAVPAVTREGSRSTKSSTTAGLSHANNYKETEKESRKLVYPLLGITCTHRWSTVGMCGVYNS